MIKLLEELLCPFAQKTPKVNQPRDVERYILENNPQNLADVERLQKQYLYAKHNPLTSMMHF